MSMINLGKIDKFYAFFVVVMVLLAAMVIYAGQGIFSSFITAYEVGQDEAQVHLRINKEKLDSVYKFTKEKESVDFELR